MTLHGFAGFGTPRGKPALPRATRLRSVSNPRPDRPTPHPSVTTAKERAPKPNSARVRGVNATSRRRLAPFLGTGPIRGKGPQRIPSAFPPGVANSPEPSQHFHTKFKFIFPYTNFMIFYFYTKLNIFIFKESKNSKNSGSPERR